MLPTSPLFFLLLTSLLPLWAFANEATTPVTDDPSPAVGALPKDDINAYDLNGDTALIRATRNKDLESLKSLITEGAGLNPQQTTQDSPLHIAAADGWLEGLQELILVDEDINQQNHALQTPLTLAILNKHSDCALALLKANASPTLVVGNNTTPLSPLHLAVRENFLEVVTQIIEGGSNINALQNGLSPLHEAILSNASQVLIYLLSKGANHLQTPIVPSAYSKATPLLLALYSGCNDCLMPLLQKGARFDKGWIEKEETSPVIYAIDKNNTQALDIFLKEGSSWKANALQSRNGKGHPPLAAAVFKNNTDIITYLISKKVNPLDKINSTDTFNNKSPADIAAFLGYVHILTIPGFLPSPEQLESSTDCWNPLYSAAASNKKEVLEALIAQYPNFDVFHRIPCKRYAADKKTCEPNLACKQGNVFDYTKNCCNTGKNCEGNNLLSDVTTHRCQETLQYLRQIWMKGK